MPLVAVTLPDPSSTALRLLFVEDNPLDAILVTNTLRRNGRQLEMVRVETREAFLEELEKRPDVILCDYHLPAFDAPEALYLLKQRGLDVPFIILSGSIGEETAVAMMKLGADDYLLKDRLGRLDAAIQHALDQKTLRDESRRAAENLRQSEFKYRCLFDHLMDAAYLCEAATLRIIDTNLQSGRLLGLDRSDILGCRLNQFFRDGSLDRLHGLSPDDAHASLRFEAQMTGTGDTRVQINARLITIQEWHLVLVLVRSLDGKAE